MAVLDVRKRPAACPSAVPTSASNRAIVTGTKPTFTGAVRDRWDGCRAYLSPSGFWLCLFILVLAHGIGLSKRPTVMSLHLRSLAMTLRDLEACRLVALPRASSKSVGDLRLCAPRMCCGTSDYRAADRWFYERASSITKMAGGAPPACFRSRAASARGPGSGTARPL